MIFLLEIATLGSLFEWDCAQGFSRCSMSEEHLQPMEKKQPMNTGETVPVGGALVPEQGL